MRNDPKPILLTSKRGTRVFEKRLCNNCGAPLDVLWRYAQSNYGTVYICTRCKMEVFERSFGKIDAMNMAVHLGRSG